MARTSSRRSQKNQRDSFRPSLEELERRVMPIVGANGLAEVVARGGDFDGVVQVSGAGGGGSGALMASGRHVLTAAHVVDRDGTTAAGGVAAADGPVTVRFDMIRDGNPINITWTVPAASVIVHPNWAGSNNIGRGYDFAIIPLTDLITPANDRHEIAPMGAQRYPLFNGNARGRTIVQVGYGETGEGNEGERTDEVQRVTIDNPSGGALGGTFTLSFNGSAPTAPIPWNASAAQVASALTNLATIGTDGAGTPNVAVRQVGPGVWDVRFGSYQNVGGPGVIQLGALNVPQMTANGAGLADGDPAGPNPSVTVTTRFDANQPGINGVKRLGFNTVDDIVNVSPRDSRGIPTDLNNNMSRYDFDNGTQAQNVLGASIGLGIEGFGARGDSGGPGLIWNNGWEIAFVKSMVESPGPTFDLTDYRLPANTTRNDFSFGEVSRDGLVVGFINSFFTPNLRTRYHLILDMNQQVLGLDGRTENLDVIVRHNGSNLEIEVVNRSAPVMFGVYYSAPLSEILSLTLRGSGDDETFIIEDNVSGGL